MFDIGWQELFVLAVLAIIVIGPKDLPRAIRTVTDWIRKARGMVRDLQHGVDDMVREVELDDIKKQANSIMADEFDAAGTITRELDMTDEQSEWSKAVTDLKNSTDPNRVIERNGTKEIGVEYEDIASTTKPQGKSNIENGDLVDDSKKSE